MEAFPECSVLVRYWDVAASDHGDWTDGCLMARSPDGVFYVVDVTCFQLTPGRRDERIRNVAEMDRQRYGRVTVWLESEAGVMGTERTQALVRRLAGHTVKTERPTGSKQDRADSVASQAELGNLYLVRGAWNVAFLDELTSFPYGRHDDQVDSLSGAFAKLTTAGPAQMVTFPWLYS